MLAEVIEILNEDFDGHANIADWCVKENGTLITDVIVNDEGNDVEFWSGNPIEDKHAEQINVSFDTLSMLYSNIVNWL